MCSSSNRLYTVKANGVSVLPTLTAHHYALTIFFDKVKMKTNFCIQLYVVTSSITCSTTIPAAFLFVETFRRMNSRGMVDNSCKPGVPACRHRNCREFDIKLEVKFERYLKKRDFLSGFLKSERLYHCNKITCMHIFTVMVEYLCCKVYNVCKA